MELLEREFIYLWYYFDVQLRQIFQYWVLGMLLGSAVSVFLKDRIHRTFQNLGQKKLGVLGPAVSSILGIASPLCMYGTIPIAASFSPFYADSRQVYVSDGFIKENPSSILQALRSQRAGTLIQIF